MAGSLHHYVRVYVYIYVGILLCLFCIFASANVPKHVVFHALSPPKVFFFMYVYNILELIHILFCKISIFVFRNTGFQSHNTLCNTHHTLYSVHNPTYPNVNTYFLPYLLVSLNDFRPVERISGHIMKEYGHMDA